MKHSGGIIGALLGAYIFPATVIEIVNHTYADNTFTRRIGIDLIYDFKAIAQLLGSFDIATVILVSIGLILGFAVGKVIEMKLFKRRRK